MAVNVEKAYSNEAVMASLGDVSWFTPEYIQQVHQEVDPELDVGIRQHPYTGFKDADLGRFLGLSNTLRQTGHAEFFAVRAYLAKRMLIVGNGPKAIEDVPFIDPEIEGLATKLNVGLHSRINSQVGSDLTSPLSCLVAPLDLRESVVSVLTYWEDPLLNNQALVWHLLVRKGVEQYMAEKAAAEVLTRKKATDSASGL